MVRSGFEIPQFFIVENSKQPINFNSVTNVYFWKPGSNFGIFKRPSKSGTCGSKAKSSQKLSSPSLLNGRGCGNEIFGKWYIFVKAWEMGSINLAYIVPKPTKVWYIDLIDDAVK